MEKEPGPDESIFTAPNAPDISLTQFRGRLKEFDTSFLQPFFSNMVKVSESQFYQNFENAIDVLLQPNKPVIVTPSLQVSYHHLYWEVNFDNTRVNYFRKWRITRELPEVALPTISGKQAEIFKADFIAYYYPPWVLNTVHLSRIFAFTKSTTAGATTPTDVALAFRHLSKLQDAQQHAVLEKLLDTSTTSPMEAIAVALRI